MVGAGVKGVLVADVDPSSPAAEKNVRAGDVIVEVSGQAVASPDQVARRLEAGIKAGKKVELFLINRGGDLTYIGLRLK
jgi:serine protease Do